MAAILGLFCLTITWTEVSEFLILLTNNSLLKKLKIWCIVLIPDVCFVFLPIFAEENWMESRNTLKYTFLCRRLLPELRVFNAL